MRLARYRTGALAVVFALLTLTAWAFASPIGAAPDDDYHLISTWCAGPLAADACEPVDADPTQRAVPGALESIACYAQRAEKSADCQGREFDWAIDELVVTDRGNFQGAYPPVYYAVNGLLSSDDVQASALGMRVLTILVFLGIAAGLWLLLPERRTALAWGWLITTIPLGVFIIASNNPSAWAVIGVGTSWMALLGWFEAAGRRKLALGALFVVGVLMAAGARGDGALYSGLGIAVVLVLVAARSRRFVIDAILPVVMGIVALGFFLAARQSQSGLQGFGGSANTGPLGGSGVTAAAGAADPAQSLSGFALLAYNLLNVPFLWSGSFGDWALGWLDTSMPAIVPLAGAAAFVAVGFAGIASMTARKAIGIGVLVLVLAALPLYVLQAGGDVIGEQVQPRYLLPLVVMLGGLLLLTQRGQRIALTRAQRFTVVAALAGAHFVALHLNIRRYVTGIDGAGPNLDAGAEWWWAGPIGPNAVWLLGSLAYLGLLVVLAPLLAPSPPAPVRAPFAPITPTRVER